MTLYAHRGWSANSLTFSKENTMEALVLANSAGIEGVEIDIRRHPDTKKLVLSHDPIDSTKTYATLESALLQISTNNLKVIVEFKELDHNIYAEVINLLGKYKLTDSAILFGFENVIKNLPWHKPREVKFGIIVEYPWDIKKKLNKYDPDVLLLGWDDRSWTYLAFRTWWSIASLKKLSYNASVDIIAGVAQSSVQLRWLKSQKIKGYTADMECCKE